MTRETKFGLLFVLVLTGVFGMLVYKKMHQPADLVAGTNEEAGAETPVDQDPATDSPATTPPPLLTATTTPSSVAKDDPFAVTPPVKPITAPRPDLRAPTANKTPALSEFETNLAQSKPTSTPVKLPTSLPDEDFISPPPATTSARSSTPAAEESDPFAIDFTATTTTPPPAATSSNAPEIAAANETGNTSPAEAFDPFSDPVPTIKTPVANTAAMPAEVESDPTDPFDAPATIAESQPVSTPAKVPVAALPVEDDPFMAPAASPKTVTTSQTPSAPAFDFDAPAETVTVESDPAPALDFGEATVSTPLAKSTTAAMESEPGASADDPFLSTPEVKVTTRPATPLPTSVDDLPTVTIPAPVRPTEVPEAKVATIPEATLPADFPDLEPPKVVSAAPEVSLPTGSRPSNPPASIPEPDPFGLPQNETETEFPSAKPIPVPLASAPVMPVAPRVATNAGTYEVQLTDSFWTISKQVYGTGRYYQALAKHNAAIASDPQKLKPGSVIETPSAEILETRYRAEIPLAAAATGASIPDNSDAAEPGFFVDASGKAMYRVGSNDTLSSISKAHLGRASRWIQIFEMNRQILKDGNTLKVGTELQLPADASQVQVVDFQQPGR